MARVCYGLQGNIDFAEEMLNRLSKRETRNIDASRKQITQENLSYSIYPGRATSTLLREAHNLKVGKGIQRLVSCDKTT